MIREQIKGIWLDDREPIYGHEQAYVNYPTVYPTVNFELVSTWGLVELADKVRSDAGYKPMSYPQGEPDEFYDLECWYDFYIDLNGYNDTGIDACISFVVVNSDQDDNEQLYTIDLSVYEQIYLYDLINKELNKDNSSCEIELAEAEKEMNEYFEYLAKERATA